MFEEFILSSHVQVPVWWMAPESIIERTFTASSDVWSFGVLMWEVYSRGAWPFENYEVRALIDALEDGTRLSQPKDCPGEVFVPSFVLFLISQIQCDACVLAI